MYSMAESWFHYAQSDEFNIHIILAPDTVLILFIDGSSILESARAITVFESCWNEV